MCVFNNVNMFICLCKDTGTMNRPLRLAECSLGISWVDVECLRSVRHVIGRPFAAVGADLSCPCIRKHIRNGKGNAYLVVRICVFGYVRIRAR